MLRDSRSSALASGNASVFQTVHASAPVANARYDAITLP